MTSAVLSWTRARQMEEEGQKIIKLNLGNLAVFGFDAPEEIQQDMIRNLPNSAGYQRQQRHFWRAQSGDARDPKARHRRRDVGRHLPGQWRQRTHHHGHQCAAGQWRRVALAHRPITRCGRRRPACRAAHRCITCATKRMAGCPIWTIFAPKSRPAPKASSSSTPTTRRVRCIRTSCSKQIIQIAREHGLVIFADEVYDKVLYDGIKHTAHGSLSDDVLTLTFNSLSKSYRSCGYRAGWMVVSGDKTVAKDYIEGPEHALQHEAVLQRARPVGDSNRAGRLPKHQRAGGRGRPPAPPARFGL